MVLTYYVILTIMFFIGLPWAAKNKIFGLTCSEIGDYSPERNFNESFRRGTAFVFFVLFAALVFLCINKDADIQDNQMYMMFYDAGGRWNSSKEFEPVFVFITKIAPTYQWLLGIFAFLSVGTHLLGIWKNSPNLWLSIILYLGFTFALHDMIQIRAALAAGIFIIGFRYAIERKWWIYFSLVAISILCHYSAIVFIPLYFLPKKNLNKLFWSSVVIIGLILGFLEYNIGLLARYIPLQIVEHYLESYVGNRDHTASTNGLIRILKCFVIILMIIRVDEIKKFYPYAVFLLPIYIFSQLCYLLFGDIAVLQSRLGELFGIVEIFTLAMFPMAWRKHYYILILVPLAFFIQNNIFIYNLISISE